MTQSKTGRKTIYTQVMKTRQVRFPDLLWAKCLRIGGGPALREFVENAPDKKPRKGKK